MGYWEERYKGGGTSGKGSVGAEKEWKWSVIDRYGARLDDVIDVGCGDLSFWDARPLPERYIGIDISPTVIERNKTKLPNLKFICSSADRLLDIGRSRTVLCLDVLFHIMDDDVYEKILENLAAYSSGLIFVHTWSANPFVSLRYRVRRVRNELAAGKVGAAIDGLRKGSSDGSYQRYRRFEDYLGAFGKANFELQAAERNVANRYGTLYVLKLKLS